MLEPGRYLDFAEEAVTAQRGGELGPEHFDGDWPVVLQVFRQIDRGHAAGPDLAFDAVPAAQGALETLEHDEE
jgi:hypothetical protein